MDLTSSDESAVAEVAELQGLVLCHRSAKSWVTWRPNWDPEIISRYSMLINKPALEACTRNILLLCVNVIYFASVLSGDDYVAR